ncbi:hypothetical protein LTS18_014978, partial [Coniosporium uncinatum]
MLIGVCGGICAGKSSVASYLIDEHNFRRLYLSRTSSTPTVEKSASHSRLPSGTRDGDVVFRAAEELVDFVTKHWRERWVTTDIWDEKVLDVLVRRPFFLLVSVDAP